ncbi:unnamed protein product [Parnassius apollo]|uniref:(apollo) hypothetical protein n=1 Tax=Parnassius apollo TaxID=110799 RepID=A0A8S3WYD9_PARAO|nr:unnamed protein product [Parnassius apollo]
MPFEKPVIVIDNGSYNIKAGFSCDNHPVSIFRNVVGRPSYLNEGYGREYYDVNIGDDGIYNTEDLYLNRPVINGQIANWDNMERVWHHIFYLELKAAPEDRAVLLACSPTSPISEKIKCCEVFFETLNSPALCLRPQCVLALYGSGVTTGVCVDVGHDNTNINPIYEGGVINYAHMQTHIGGKQISNFIEKHLQERNLNLGTQVTDIVEEIKRDCLYRSFNSCMHQDDVCEDYLLPDGTKINVGEETLLSGEFFFQPELINTEQRNYLPLHEAITTSVLKCDPDLTSELYDAVALCGGSSMVPGFDTRLSAEIKKIIDSPITLLSSPEGYATVWLGGAVFASLPESRNVWISKSSYEDQGEKIIRKKIL